MSGKRLRRGPSPAREVINDRGDGLVHETNVHNIRLSVAMFLPYGAGG